MKDNNLSPIKGETNSLINKPGVELVEENGISLPLYILDPLKLKDTGTFSEILVGYHPKDDKLTQYKGLRGFSEVRIGLYPKTDFKSATVSCILMDPHDIEDLLLHEVYQYQLQKTLLEFPEVKIWMNSVPSVKEIKKNLKKISNQKDSSEPVIIYNPIGFVGFHIELKGSSFKTILSQLIKFIQKVDALTRKAIFN
jgi:hypothetical protein